MSRELDEIRQLDEPLIIYAGPEIAAAAGLPTQRQLFERLLAEAEDYLSARQHRELGELGEGDDFAEAFGELERALSTPIFGGIVERTLSDDQAEVPALAQAIAALGEQVRGVITPNLDHLLERAFGGQLTVFPRPTADLATRRGWLLKLHGTLSDRQSWVLTEEQRGRVLYRDPLHQQVFRSLFLSRPILFVGSSLGDPVLAELVSQIKSLAQGQPPRHWALVDERETGPTKRRKFAGAGIRLIGYANDSGDHAGCIELLRALAGTGSDAPASTGAVSPPAPAPAAAPVTASPPPATATPAAAAPVSTPTPAPTTAGTPDQLAILFLAANPAGTDPLRLDRELRVIREAIERSRHRTTLRLEIRTAATIHDLRRALLDGQFDLVHLSGHGEQEGLLLEDESGECVEVPKRALARLFARYAPPNGALRCVVLNACWSLSTGESTAMDVPFTVAMDGPISDRGALEFSRGFYDALGAGLAFPDAYEEGRTCVDLAAPDAKFEAVFLRSDQS